MNSNLKNILSFIKEALELNDKNIYNVKNYEIFLDFGKFYRQFSEVVNFSDFVSLNINSDGIIFKLQYISDDKRRVIPQVPSKLKDYITINDNDIIPLVDDLEKKLAENNLINEYRNFDREIKEVNRFNSLIDSYNSEYMKFYDVYKRINDYEEKIEVIFGQKLLVWRDGQNHSIERFILEANLDISIDSIHNVILFEINKDKFRGFVSDFLNFDLYKIKDINGINAFIRQFNTININEDFDLATEIEKYVNYASFENEIVDKDFQSDDILKYGKTYIFNNAGIIVRKRNIKLWIDDLEKIIGCCDNTEFLSPILNMFEIDFTDDNQVYSLLNDQSYVDTKDDEVLFPLPSNDEQYKIVDKVKSSNIVLVQGPPGTGKSHTIVNLLSHYISEGKKVLVTSEKAKALEVLRNKIPSSIRSLSLSLLTSNGVDKELESSIETVIKKQKDEKDLKLLEVDITRLQGKLQENHKKKQENIKSIIDLMFKGTVSHRQELNEVMDFENTNNLTLMDLAIWLDNNKQYKLVPIEDSENFSYNNAVEFFEKLDDIADDIRDNHFAISTHVPIHDYLKTNDIELYIKESLGYRNYVIHSTELLNSVKQSELNENVINQLCDKIDTLSVLYDFFDKKWIKSNLAYEVFNHKLVELYDLINQNCDFFVDVESKLYDFSVSFEDESKKGSYLNAIHELLKCYNDNHSVRLTSIFKYNSYFKFLNGLLYNGKVINKDNVNLNDLQLMQEAITYYDLIDSIKEKIVRVLDVDLFEKYNIPKNQFAKYKDKIISVLNALINYDSISREIDECFKTIVNENLFSVSYLDLNESDLKFIIEDLKYYLNENFVVNKNNQIVNNLREFYKDYNLQNLDKTLVSIEGNHLEEYIYNKSLLIHELNVINQYNNLKELYSGFVSEKQNIIRKYIYDFSFEEKQFFKSNIDKIFKYHFVETYYLIYEKEQSVLPDLYADREKLIEEEKSIITNLVAVKGWYFQNKNMNYNTSISLNKWLNLKKKLGSGKGKNASLYLRQMREEMQTAKNAIPVWIMPNDKVIEQYPFTNEPPFDVLIMDESSQSSLFSVSVLSRAKKIIIVGDNMQISPTNAFTSIEDITDLRAKYLKNNEWDLQISKDTSIYDLVQTVCGNKKIVLTEHFRCLPEIIHYSNKQFYNMAINPLKVRGKDNTIKIPIKTVYVPNAVCKKIGNQVFNQDEIDRIVMLVGEILNDKQYDNKTIGIIVLQNSSKYIQKLSELLMQKFGEALKEERNIKVGTTYDFQGDERDVIILGMVISSVSENGDKYNFKALTTSEFDKSFNVAASRAKEQMILVHSVRLDELSPSCNRYKLLNYCLNYNNEIAREHEKKFESNFEKDVYDYLVAHDYQLIPQFKVGKYRIDFVLENNNDQKIAIECDGDSYHSINELEHDLERQSILERCGWKFVRIRASEFYYDRTGSMNKLINTIEYYLNDNVIY